MAFGNIPKFNNGGDVLKYGAFKALDGLGAAGSGQLALGGYNALLKMGWLQNVSMNGTAQIIISELGLLGVFGAGIYCNPNCCFRTCCWGSVKSGS